MFGILLKLGEIRIGIKQKNAQVLKEAVLDLRESSVGIGWGRPQTAVSVNAKHHATFVAKCKCFAPFETVSTYYTRSLSGRPKSCHFCCAVSRGTPRCWLVHIIHAEASLNGLQSLDEVSLDEGMLDEDVAYLASACVLGVTAPSSTSL